MIDFIGGKHVVIRRRGEGIAIRQLRGEQPQLLLSAEDWFELVQLVQAIISAVDFKESYDQDGSEGIS